MTTALEYIRYSCGIAGEEVATQVDELESTVASLTAENEKLKLDQTRLTSDLLGQCQCNVKQQATITRQQAVIDELRAQPVGSKLVGWVVHDSTIPREHRDFTGCRVLDEGEESDYHPKCLTAIYAAPAADAGNGGK